MKWLTKSYIGLLRDGGKIEHRLLQGSCGKSSSPPVGSRSRFGELEDTPIPENSTQEKVNGLNTAYRLSPYHNHNLGSKTEAEKD